MLDKFRDKSQIIFLVISFVILFFSYSANIWHVADSNYNMFDRPDERNVIGRLDKSANEGFFSYGLLTGATDFWPDSLPPAHSFNDQVNLQYSYFLSDKPIPGNEFVAYKSQTGGQAIMYSILQQFLPFSNHTNIKIFRAINAILVSLCFVLFLGWCYRNFGFISSLITFIFIFLSPWLVKFGYNLWWALWSFYIPFLTITFLMEKKAKKPESVSERKVLLAVFLSMFVKCIFTGFEFISSTLVMAICPIIFYGIACGMNINKLLIFVVKASICALLGVVAEMPVLITQIKFYNGTFMDGINHILYSFTKRASFAEGQEVYSVIDLLKIYCKDYPLMADFMPTLKFGFGTLAFVCLVFGSIIFLKSRKIGEALKRKNTALVVVMLVAIIGPASWFIIFKQHASMHFFLDYITWYMPFLLYEFLVIGQGINLLVRKHTK